MQTMSYKKLIFFLNWGANFTQIFHTNSEKLDETTSNFVDRLK